MKTIDYTMTCHACGKEDVIPVFEECYEEVKRSMEEEGGAYCCGCHKQEGGK